MKRPIVHIPSDILSAVSKTVTSFDKRLEKLVSDMKTTLLATENPKGVGLAAVQIGELWRVFITKPTPKAPVLVFINPEIIDTSEQTTDGVPERDNKLEGCLSIPDIWGKVRRHESATLRYQDIQGQTHEEVFNGFMATIIQHETDHTNGVIFTRRVLEQNGPLYQQTKDKQGKSVLEEFKI